MRKLRQNYLNVLSLGDRDGDLHEKCGKDKNNKAFLDQDDKI